MKRFFAILLIACLCIGCVTGCKKDSDGKIALEDPAKVPEDTYEINWYLMADAQNDVRSVEEAINDYLKDKINATVKIYCLPSAQYQQKLTNMINAGEYFDMCFVARWMLDYVNNARAGAFTALDDYFEDYLSGTVAGFEPEVLDCSRVDGKLYAMPVNKEMATQYGWIYRKDIADKYDIDMTKYKSFEELEPVLKLIKQKEKEMNYPIDWANDSAPAALLMHELWIPKYGYDSHDQTKAFNPFATEEFMQACKTARDFYNKGYVRPDVLTATDQLQRMKEGKTFVMLQPLKPGKAKELFKGSAFEFEQAEVTPPIIDYLAGTGSMQAISATSKNPVRVMRFMELLNTDPYLKNLVIHGIEGKHYNKIDDKTVEPIKKSGYDMYSNSWSIGNVFIDYLTETEDPNKLEDLKKFNDSAKSATVNKFMTAKDDDAEFRDTEITAVIGDYKKQCALGVVDPETTIKEFNKQLEKCGIKEQLKWIQDQYDDYLKTIK